MSFSKNSTQHYPCLHGSHSETTERYTNKYAIKLYRRMCAKLRQGEQPPRDELLSETRLILLFVDKGDESELPLFHSFGIEALVLPFGRDTVGNHSPTTGNPRGRMANRLARDARRAIRHARNLLDEIAWEVSKRDSRTCLLLPHRTFGRQMDQVFDHLKQAASNRTQKELFRAQLKRLSNSMPKRREGNHRYYVNQDKVVFKSLPKSGPRHGLAPTWGDTAHDPSLRIERKASMRRVIRPESPLRLQHSARTQPNSSKLPWRRLSDREVSKACERRPERQCSLTPRELRAATKWSRLHVQIVCHG